MIIVVVSRPWFQQSPWKSYTKVFETELDFLNWWHSLADNSFTKSKAKIDTFEGERVDILAPWVMPQ